MCPRDRSLSRVRWNTEVTIDAVPGPGMPGNNGWAVSSGSDTRYYENVIVATGHHRTRTCRN